MPAMVPPQIAEETMLQHDKIPHYKDIQVIECFATWCAPCRAMVPQLEKLTKEYPEVYLISISDERKEVVEQFITKHKLTYNVSCSNEGKKLMNKLGMYGIPCAFLFYHQTLVWKGHPSSLEI